jgi:hypothetical protein
VELLIDPMHATASANRTDAPVIGRSFDVTIPTSVSLALLAAWVLGLTWLFAISPEPDPANPASTLDTVIALAMLGSWTAAFAGLGARRRFGLHATIAGAVLLAAAGVLCAATGHTGLWIPIQIGVGVGLASLGGLASRLS